MASVAGSAHIRTRRLANGEKRFIVRWRMGGRAFPLLHGGSFKVQRLAKERRDFILGELAAGRDPRTTLAALASPQAPALLTERFNEFIDSRIDVAEKTKALYRNARDRLGMLATRDPASLTAADIQAWVAELVRHGLSRGTVQHYLADLRQVLDFCDVDPNPARNRKVKLPAADREEVSPPSREEWLAILDACAREFLLPLRLIEATGLRIGELLQLVWGDVDFAHGRFRISRARTKGRTAGQRWLPVPPELLDELMQVTAPEDRSAERTIFGSLTDTQVRKGLARAAVDAGVVHRHPHELRHRRVSLWVAHGFDPVVVKTWSGHTNASTALDIYSHVLIDPRADEWREFWVEVYSRERRLLVGESTEVRQ